MPFSIQNSTRPCKKYSLVHENTERPPELNGRKMLTTHKERCGADEEASFVCPSECCDLALPLKVLTLFTSDERDSV